MVAWPNLHSPAMARMAAMAPAPSPAQARRPRKAVAAAQLIETHLKDPNFLMALLRHGPTADFLAETLKSKASQDDVFANLVVQSCVPLTPKVKRTPTTPCKRSASTMKSRVMSQSPGLRPGVVPRSLLTAFEESPEAPESRIKAARFQEANLLDPLPLVLVAQVSSFLKLREKLLFLGSNRQARSLRDLQCTWQPLLLEAEDSAHILRQIRNCDPQGCMDPKFYPGPSCAVWREVTEVRVELMDADRVEDENGEPLRYFRKASTMMKLILDPIQEFARRLSAGWFAGALSLHVSNIEVDCMDSGFLDFRGGAFRDFAQVKLEQDGLDPMKYCLFASRTPRQLPSIGDGYAMVQGRFPEGATVNRLLNSPEDISLSEALFLKEHTFMVKTGHVFRSVQRLWHVIPEHEVREQYDLLHARLLQELHRDGGTGPEVIEV